MRLALLLLLAATGCAAPASHVRAPRPMFDVSRICDHPHYQRICEPAQAPAALPEVAPIRVDTNLATPTAATLALRG